MTLPLDDCICNSKNYTDNEYESKIEKTIDAMDKRNIPELAYHNLA
jgi:hypothetical protein